MKWQTHTVTGSAHKSPCEWNERVFAGCENILRHTPLQTLPLINLSALCFESNLVQPPEKHSAVSGAWLCFEGRGLLPSQSTARLRCKNTSSRGSTLASSYAPHTWRSSAGLKNPLTIPALSCAVIVRFIISLSSNAEQTVLLLTISLCAASSDLTVTFSFLTTKTGWKLAAWMLKATEVNLREKFTSRQDRSPIGVTISHSARVFLRAWNLKAGLCPLASTP